MGIILEAILNWFAIGKMDDTHERNPKVFWAIFATFIVLLALIGLWGLRD